MYIWLWEINSLTRSLSKRHPPCRGKIVMGVRAKLQTTVYPSKFNFHNLRLRQNPFQTIPVISFFDPRHFFVPNLLVRKFDLECFFLRFGGADDFWTPPAALSRYFALDAPIIGYVRPLADKNRAKQFSWQQLCPLPSSHTHQKRAFSGNSLFHKYLDYKRLEIRNLHDKSASLPCCSALYDPWRIPTHGSIDLF